MFSKNSNSVREILFSRGKNESHQKILAPRYIKMTVSETNNKPK